MAQFDLKSYARRGAEARLAELREEMNAIYGVFPDLRRGRPAATPSDGSTAAPSGRRRRRRMSAAARKRMAAATKARWAAAKKAGKSRL